MQVSLLSAQSALVSKLIEWYLDATSVPYGHFLIFGRVQRIDYVSVQTLDP